MAEAESLQSIKQTRAPFSAWLGVVLLFAVFGAIVLAIVGPSPRSDNYEQMRAIKRAGNLKTLHDEDAKALAGYSWIDKNKGTARIPIERAIELTMADLKTKEPTAAGPIATPAPTAAQAPAAATPTASASPKPSATPKATAVSGPNSEAHNQPAAAANPPAAPPGTQPGANATPAAKPAVSPPAPSPAPQ